MAVMEQLIYGVDTAKTQPSRQVLGKSPGVNRSILEEVVRFCDSWGALPPDVPARKVLMSFPLDSQHSDDQARLYAIIQVVSDPAQLFHADILTARDFGSFGMNPYALAHEQIFLNQHGPGQLPDRREICPSSLEPLVTPLPSRHDVPLVEEALSTYLTTGKVVLPLASGCDESDRMMALLIAALPASRRAELRFASFAISEANRYTLVAMHGEGAGYGGWQRFLMSTMTGQLTPPQAQYISEVKDCLLASDLMALEKTSNHSSPFAQPEKTSRASKRPVRMSAPIT